MKSRSCPVCGGERVIIILRDGRKGICYDCGSRWVETVVGETTTVFVPGVSLPAGGHQSGSEPVS
jgi:hypothetical protein